ncbi:hypothetical protein BDY21DRAFT_157709 [Lineolata rhizophorae]|uniref:FHA domain-containing protein n=1 Tax=Lineolata rhizophorae TaxID=578093 RepID=A0A6A6NLE9_9PEZI|nr:hypothetical protein BDY21DRAFT_157709 [Lineolata rhizophorae]
MTAVAPPPNFQPIARSGWTGAGSAMSADDVSRMFMPRKSAQRANSSSSIASSASSSSTVPAPSAQPNGAPASSAPAAGDWGVRKKPPRSIWPPAKSEPISGLSNARPQSVASSSSGPSAASAMSALHTPGSVLAAQHQSQAQPNGAPKPQAQPEPQAILHLLPMNGTFERKTINVPFYPEVLRIGRQTNGRTVPAPNNGYFDSKVLSRQHAEVWADRSGKVWIRDVKSSNGTFVNGHRLSPENRDSDPHEIREQDMLELGIDIVSEDQKTVVHHKVAARVEHAGFYNNANNMMDLNFGDIDPSANGNMVGPQVGQGAGQIRRASNQGSLGNQGRMASAPPNVAGNQMSAAQQRHMSLWLNPISMEQIVKRLNCELKNARQQSQDLQRTSQYVDSLLTSEPKKEQPAKSPHTKVSPIKDIKARFSDPPAPPPQQPLPEKPDVARANTAETGIQSMLKRETTERPKIAASNSSSLRQESSNHITSLVQELTNAQKKIDTQSVQLKDLEEMLKRERLLRENAEERAHRLESAGGHLPNGAPVDATLQQPSSSSQAQPAESSAESSAADMSNPDETAKTAVIDESTTKLQQRLELMLREMDEMKRQMELYRNRAETAEAQSAKDRQSLAEMVEKIRQDEAARNNASAEAHDSLRRRRRPGSSGSHKSTESTGKEPNNMSTATTAVDAEGEVADATADEDAVVDLIRKVGMQNGRPVTPEQVDELQKAIGHALGHGRTASVQAPRHDQVAQSAPYASILGVVLLGVGLMAYLNGWQKVER